MKTIGYIGSSILCLLLTACDRSSSEKTAVAPEATVAVSDDPALCEELAESHHEAAPEGYSASANHKFHVKVDWTGPLVAGELTNAATVTFMSPHGEPLALTLSGFKLFMPAMGHGTIKSDKLIFSQNATEKNIWSVGQIYFSMGGAAGEWVVDVEGSACGITDKARVIIAQEVQ